MLSCVAVSLILRIRSEFPLIHGSRDFSVTHFMYPLKWIFPFGGLDHCWIGILPKLCIPLQMKTSLHRSIGKFFEKLNSYKYTSTDIEVLFCMLL